jgi:hypothetical protein
MSRIQDGKGSGRSAQVDDQNRLRTHAVVEDESLHASEEGNAYNINTGLISINGDATLLYYKNTGEKDFVIEAVALGSFDGITHSDDPYITLIRNPTGGDLISDGTTTGVMNQNRNFGSSNTLSGLAYKGKVSGTVTGGDDIAILQATPGGRSFYSIGFVIPKGTSMGVKLTANVTSGSANWYCALIGFEKDDTTD